MTTLREAATMALEALEGGADSWQLIGPAIDALKEALVEDAMQKFTDVSQDIEAALAEPVREPVALNDGRLWQYPDGSIGIGSAPPQCKPLTEEEILSLFRTSGSPTAFARAVERAHGIGRSME